MLILSSCKHKAEQQNDKDSLTSKVHPTETDTVPIKIVHIPAGTFDMGTNDPAFADAHPVHKVKVSEFWMDEHEVANAEFAKFVAATNYITIAERQWIQKIIREYHPKV